MDIGAWLRSLGLSRYETAFCDNSIDADVLPDLTDGDLAQLGVNLGDRKRLLKAIASLNATDLAAKPRPAPLSSSIDAAERRPITVMFCDLVGSTGLAARLDAEDWRNLVGAYLDEASAAVTGLGGHVLKKLGDGLMALFGYPHAQENDAERAVRAALAIQRALGELNARNAGRDAPQLAARIGIDSGQVVVDAAGEVFGDAPNVAARAQAAAEPGAVLVTATVQRQTAGLFVAEDKGAHELKGVPAPVALYRIVRASGGGRRGGARALTPLVGREDELALLTRRWSRALEGEGQFIQIVGEPGIGKSRLVEEFRAKLAETPHTWVEWAASQLLQNTPLHPLAEWGRLRFGGADATDEGRLADLENTLRLIGLDAAEYAPLLAPLVDIPLPGDRCAKFPPEELRRRQPAVDAVGLPRHCGLPCRCGPDLRRPKHRDRQYIVPRLGALALRSRSSSSSSRIWVSAWFTPKALTSMSTWPGCGFGSGRSSMLSASGSPYCLMTTARTARRRAEGYELSDALIAALMAQVASLTARVAELEAKLGLPPKTPDNSSVPPSKGQKPSESSAPKDKAKPHAGAHRPLHPNPTTTREVLARRCQGCGTDGCVRHRAKPMREL